MAEAGAAGRAQDVDDTSWYPAAQEAIASRIAQGTLAAFVIDEKPDINGNHQHGRLSACAVVTLEDRLPGRGFLEAPVGRCPLSSWNQSSAGRGLARAVVSAGLSWLDEMNAEVVDLHATPDAAHLYRSLGFTEHGHSLCDA
ncbi:GNAT family N-acetyltransferase [Arthrobacter agilis]|uniref:GNAT family N-acetyltransferase n=1 Tax=Arthrobacter agilis TaxID=37921 RepID=UPI00361C2407